MAKLKNIRLKSKEERRFKQGHPWVFSNELQEIPKNIEPGELVDICDAGGVRLATGFYNAHSLIAFRELFREENDGYSSDLRRATPAFFYERIKQAANFRKSWFTPKASQRLVFGEVDGLSGLIIDRFVGTQTAYVVQPHALGMDRALPEIIEALKTFSTEQNEKDAIVVLRRDAGSREREGLQKEITELRNLSTGKQIESSDAYRDFSFQVMGAMGSALTLFCDLVGGQKTGFFFDQFQNVRLLENLILRQVRVKREWGTKMEQPQRILDLCSYVGQWSAHLTQILHEREALPAEFTCVDASQSALGFARKNIESVAKQLQCEKAVKVNAVKADVLEGLGAVANDSFDIVIADPPAFIKSRKSIPEGKQAYVKLFQSAIEKTKAGGLTVFCSCSQLLSDEDFREVLGKAVRRSKKNVRFLLQGSPSFDHPARLDFQEGLYLKCFIAQVGE